MERLVRWVPANFLAVAIMSLVLAAPAFAQGHLQHGHERVPPIRGMVISVTSNAIQIQNQSGVTAATLGAKTHVIRVVSGSLTDVVSGVTVELRTQKGTTTVTGIHISAEAATAKRAQTSGGSHRGKTRVGTPGRNVPPRAGTVVSVSDASITIQSPQGQRATYPLDSNVMVIKDITGHITDLAVGQMVQVLLGRGSYATSIQILNA